MNDQALHPDLSPELGNLRFGSGHTVRRIEDPTLLRGEGRFTDDLTLPGQQHAVFVRSPHAHARIVALDAEAIRALPGVRAVFTGADLVAAGVKPMAFPANFKRPDCATATAPPRRALAHEVVRFVGEAVALVVADSAAAAEAAAQALEVDYAVLPAVGSLQAALAPGAPEVWPDAPGNRLAEARYGDAAACDAAFARAAHVVSLEI